MIDTMINGGKVDCPLLNFSDMKQCVRTIGRGERNDVSGEYISIIPRN